MNPKNIILAISILFFVVVVQAQQLKLSTNNLSLGESVRLEEESVKEQIISRLNQALYDYNNFGSCSNPDQSKRFIDLFEPGSLIYTDYKLKSKRTDKVDLVNYVDGISNNFSAGLNFTIEEAALLYIGNNKDYNYEARIQIQKTLYRILDKNKIKRDNNGYIVKLDLYLELDRYDESKYTISNIEGTTIDKKKKEHNNDTYSKPKAESHLILSGGYSIGMVNAKQGEISESYRNLFSDENSIASNYSSISAGLKYRRALNRRARTFLYGSVSISNSTVFTDLSNYKDNFEISKQTTAYQSGDGTKRVEDALRQLNVEKAEFKIDGIDNLEERINFYNIQFSLGYARKLYRGDRAGLMLEIGPVFNLLRGSETDIINSNESVSGFAYPINSFFPTNQIEASIEKEEYSYLYDIGNISKITPKNKASLGVLINSSYYYELSYTIGLELGISYHHSLTTIFEQNILTQEFTLERLSSRQNSVLEDYFEKSALKNVGINVGFIFTFGDSL